MAFNISRAPDVEKIISASIIEAHRWESELGQKKTGKAEKAFRALQEGYIEIGGPQNFVTSVPHKDISNISTRGSAQKRKFNYYIIQNPILLYPGRGAQYRLLEVQMKFGASKAKDNPSILNIFPANYWKPVFSWGSNFSLCLDGDFQWKIFDSSNVMFPPKSLPTVQNKINSYIKVLPFEFEPGRMEVTSQLSSTKAMWRIDSKKIIGNQKKLSFVTVIQVPAHVRQLKLETAIQAEISFEWLAAQISHVYAKLADSISQLSEIFEKRQGLPLQSFKTWTIDLP